MDNDIIERLIECVRRNVFLYDLSHKDYKNITIKAVIWESIGRELNQTGEAVRNKWKTIRDGYTKHKKLMKGTTGSARKNSNYAWAAHLAFLDNFNLPRPSCSNVEIERIPSPPPPPSPLPPPTLVSDLDVTSPSNPTPPLRSTPSPSGPSLESLSNVPTASTSRFSAITSRNRNVVRPNTRTDDDVGRVLDFINAKKRKQYDGIDHLFLSYADTFKKFPKREQALLKLELAKLFSNTELQLLNSASIDQYHHTSTTSSAYSNITSIDNSTCHSPPLQQNLSENLPVNLKSPHNTGNSAFFEQYNLQQGHLPPDDYTTNFDE